MPRSGSFILGIKSKSQGLTEGDDTRGCGDTIGAPDDEQGAARNI